MLNGNPGLKAFYFYFLKKFKIYEIWQKWGLGRRRWKGNLLIPPVQSFGGKKGAASSQQGDIPKALRGFFSFFLVKNSLFWSDISQGWCDKDPSASIPARQDVVTNPSSHQPQPGGISSFFISPLHSPNSLFSRHLTDFLSPNSLFFPSNHFSVPKLSFLP